MWVKKLYKNPLRVIITTFITCVSVGMAGAPIADIGHSGGEAVGLTFFAVTIHATWYITVAAAIITLFFYRDWVKKYWYKNAIVITVGLGVIVSGLIEQNSENYSLHSETVAANGIEWLKTTEYYPGSFDSRHIRSISFLLNDDIKDSTWTTYAQDGTVLVQKLYIHGKLIKQYLKK